MQRIERIAINDPELLGIYQLDDKRYILIGEILNQDEFYCNAISLEKDNKVCMKNKKAKTAILKIIRK